MFRGFLFSGTEKRDGFSFALLLALGAALRLLFLGKNDLWYDEAAAFFIAKTGFHHIGPHLYVRFLKDWMGLFGASEFSLRLPSALVSIASLPFAYLLFKKMFDAKTGLLVVLLMALSPFHLWYAQEARHYAFGLFWGLASSTYLYCYLKSEKKADLALYLVSSSLGYLVHFKYVPLSVLQCVFVLVFARKDLKKTLLLLSPLLWCIPRYGIFSQVSSFMKAGFWIPLPTSASLFITMENFIFGYNGTALLYRFSDLIMALALALPAIRLLKKNAPEKELAFCITLSLLPLAAIHILSFLYMPLYLDRVFFMFTPYYYGLVAWSIGQIKGRLLKTGVVLCLVLGLAVSDARYYSNLMYQPENHRRHQGTFVKKPFKPLAGFLKRTMRESDFLFFGYSAPLYPLVYYLGDDARGVFSRSLFVYDPGALDTNTRRPFGQVYKNDFYVAVEEAFLKLGAGKRRVFFLGGTFQRDGGLDENSRKVKEALDQRLGPAQAMDFDGLKLFIYEKNP